MSVWAQFEVIDSLQMLLSNGDYANENEQVDIYFQLTDLLSISLPDSAISYGKSGLQVAQKFKMDEHALKLQRSMSRAYLALGDVDEARSIMSNMMESAIQNQDRKWIVLIALGQALTAKATGMKEYAIQRFNFALEWVDDDNSIEKGLIYSGLAELLEKQDEKLRYYSLAESIFRAHDDDDNLCRTYLNLSAILISLDRYDDALKYLNNADLLADQTNLVQVEAGVNLMRAQVYYAKGDEARATQYAESALAMSHKINHHQWVAKARVILGISEYKAENYQRSIELLKKAYEVLKDPMDYVSVENCTYFLKLNYAALQDYKNAYYWSDAHGVLVDTTNSVEAQTQLAEIEARYQTLEQNNQRLIQEERIRKQSFINRTIIGLAFSLLCLAAGF